MDEKKIEITLTCSVDKLGRLYVPKKIRDTYDIEGGDIVTFRVLKRVRGE